MASIFEELTGPTVRGYAESLGASWAKASLKKSQVRRKLRALQNALAVGAYLFRQVRGIERSWISQIVTGIREYDPRDEQVFRAMYAEWFEPVAEVQSRIAELENLGRKVSGAKTFTRQAREVQRILAAWPKHRDPRPVRIDEAGNLFEINGESVDAPGLPPSRIAKAMADMEAGRYRPLREILAERRANGL